jgi:hypothetical protein
LLGWKGVARSQQAHLRETTIGYAHQEESIERERDGEREPSGGGGREDGEQQSDLDHQEEREEGERGDGLLRRKKTAFLHEKR